MFRSLLDVPNDQISLEKRLQNLGTPGLIVVTLIVLAILVAVAPSVNQWATTTEKWWGFVSTAFTVVGGTVGLWFVWLKFIRAREFAPRLDVALTAGKSFLTDADGMLHWCGVRMENKGAVSVDYEIEVLPLLHLGSASSPGTVLQPLAPAATGSTPKVDVGGSAYEHFITAVPLSNAQAVTFQVKVKQGQYVWRGCITQSNLKEPPK
ncbi:MAG: hypothetical protein IT319_21725 [Anaerolineae bacterium]|nr:hypothetical protein [Anaerolineae bacterium]